MRGQSRSTYVKVLPHESRSRHYHCSVDSATSNLAHSIAWVSKPTKWIKLRRIWRRGIQAITIMVPSTRRFPHYYSQTGYMVIPRLAGKCNHVSCYGVVMPAETIHGFTKCTRHKQFFLSILEKTAPIIVKYRQSAHNKSDSMTDSNWILSTTFSLPNPPFCLARERGQILSNRLYLLCGVPRMIHIYLLTVMYQLKQLCRLKNSIIICDINLAERDIFMQTLISALVQSSCPFITV